MDANDNPPSDGGQLDVTLNTYEGKFIGGDVARVYILDKDRVVGDIYQHDVIGGGGRPLKVGENGMVAVEKDVKPGTCYIIFMNMSKSIYSYDYKKRVDLCV